MTSVSSDVNVYTPALCFFLFAWYIRFWFCLLHLSGSFGVLQSSRIAQSWSVSVQRFSLSFELHLIISECKIKEEQVTQIMFLKLV